MEIYILFIPDSATENTIKELFRRYGQVKTVRIMTYKSTGERTGRAFVDMPNDHEAEKAIAELNGKEFQGSKIFVEKALSKAYEPKTK
jgi:RNA recognition motif-containing protein